MTSELLRLGVRGVAAVAAAATALRGSGAVAALDVVGVAERMVATGGRMRPG